MQNYVHLRINFLNHFWYFFLSLRRHYIHFIQIRKIRQGTEQKIRFCFQSQFFRALHRVCSTYIVFFRCIDHESTMLTLPFLEYFLTNCLMIQRFIYGHIYSSHGQKLKQSQKGLTNHIWTPFCLWEEVEEKC